MRELIQRKDGLVAQRATPPYFMQVRIDFSYANSTSKMHVRHRTEASVAQDELSPA